MQSRLAQIALLAFLTLSVSSCFKEVDTDIVPQTAGTVNLSPSSGTKGSIINISGNNFPEASKIQVKVNGVVAPVVSSTGNQIQARIAPGSSSGNVEVIFDGKTYNAGHFEYIYTSYTLSTIPTGGIGYADGPLASAKFADMYGIAIDKSTNKMYMAERSTPRVRVIDLNTNMVSTLAGDGTVGDLNGMGTAAKLGRIRFLSVASNGDVYVADQTNSKIKKIDASGNVTTVVATGFTIEGIKVGKSGNIYVSGPSNIAKYSASGALVWRVTSKGTGNVDGDTSTVKFTVGGTLEVNVNETELYFFHRLTTTGALNSQLKVFNISSGSISTLAGTTGGGVVDGPALDGGLDYAMTPLLDQFGGIYINDYANGVLRYYKDGTLRTIIGSAGYGNDDGNESVATVYGPWGLAFDKDNNVIISDVSVVDDVTPLIRKLKVEN